MIDEETFEKIHNDFFDVCIEHKMTVKELKEFLCMELITSFVATKERDKTVRSFLHTVYKEYRLLHTAEFEERA